MSRQRTLFDRAPVAIAEPVGHSVPAGDPVEQGSDSWPEDGPWFVLWHWAGHRGALDRSQQCERFSAEERHKARAWCASLLTRVDVRAESVMVLPGE